MCRRFYPMCAVILSCLVLATLLSMLTHRARAAGSADPLAPDQGQPLWTPFNISQAVTHTQQYAEVAANSANGSYFVVWRDDAADPVLRGRLVSAAGEVLTRTLIATSTTNTNLVPWVDVAFNQVAGNQFMVVWNASDSTEGGDIYGQRVAANGVPISQTFPIHMVQDHKNNFPTIVQDAQHGQFLVVWSERWQEPFGPSHAQVSGRILDQTGAPMTDTFKIGGLENYDLSRPAAAYNSAADQFLVVWDEWYGGGQLRGQRLLHNGAAVGETLIITTFPGGGTTHVFPDVAYDPFANRYLVVWAQGANNDWNIYGQLLDASGAPVGEVLAIADSSLDQRHPAVNFYEGEQGGVFLVLWDEQQPSSQVQNKDIYGRWVTADGALLGNAVPFVTDTANRIQEQAALAFNRRTRQFLVAYQGEASHDIYGLRTTGLPYDLWVDADHFWSRPAVIRSGDAAVLTATVGNRFAQALSDVAVHFYNGDPASGGQQIGAATVHFAAGDRIAYASVPWDTTGLTGTQSLYVMVDPQNLVPELDESNNTARRDRLIRPLCTDVQPPTGVLTINAGADLTHSPAVTLTIAANDDSPSGVRWMFLRQWWAAPLPVLGDAITVPGQRGEWLHSDSGWLPYRPAYASTGFSFVLAGAPGIHYVQAWLWDGCNLSSSPPIWDAINDAPDFAWTLAPHEWHLYRTAWAPGTNVAISMTVTGDDDALAVWSPGNSAAPDLVSDLPGPNAHTEQLAFTAADGVYQILAYGQPPLGAQYQIDWQPSTGRLAATSPVASAAALPSAPVIPVDETPPVSSGLPEFQAAATGVFTTPWTAIAPGQTLTFTHNLGGDPDQYAVELWFLDDEANGAGIHHRGYGGNQVSGQLQGAFWSNLTGNTIRVTRNPNDATADRVRLRIWQAEPPDWDSGWLSIQPGDANIQTLTHNLGGNAEDYLVALKFRDPTPGGLGLHHYAYGGLDLSGQVQGAAWFNLSSTSVQVVRFAGDQAAPQVRVMIYRPDPARPPAYDSGWRTVNVGQMVTLNHNLGGNPMNYILRTAARSAQHGVNSFGAGGLTLSNGQGRGGFVQRLTGSSLAVYRLPQDIYQQEVRVRIWLPTYSLYLPLVDGGAGSATR